MNSAFSALLLLDRIYVGWYLLLLVVLFLLSFRCEKQQGNHNKLVIFTRTKPELHRITHTWPASGVSQADVEAPIQDLVFEDLHKVMLAKLDHIHTEVGHTPLLLLPRE